MSPLRQSTARPLPRRTAWKRRSEASRRSRNLRSSRRIPENRVRLKTRSNVFPFLIARSLAISLHSSGAASNAILALHELFCSVDLSSKSFCKLCTSRAHELIALLYGISLVHPFSTTCKVHLKLRKNSVRQSRKYISSCNLLSLVLIYHKLSNHLVILILISNMAHY